MELEKKFIGRIKSAEFGLNAERPFLYGLQLLFDINGDDITTYKIVNINDSCKWGKNFSRMKALELNALEICIILKEAKVNFVSQLIDKPVEITFENNLFKSFRVLN